MSKFILSEKKYCKLFNLYWYILRFDKDLRHQSQFFLAICFTYYYSNIDSKVTSSSVRLRKYMWMYVGGCLQSIKRLHFIREKQNCINLNMNSSFKCVLNVALLLIRYAYKLLLTTNFKPTSLGFPCVYFLVLFLDLKRLFIFLQQFNSIGF